MNKEAVKRTCWTIIWPVLLVGWIFITAFYSPGLLLTSMAIGGAIFVSWIIYEIYEDHVIEIDDEKRYTKLEEYYRSKDYE